MMEQNISMYTAEKAIRIDPKFRDIISYFAGNEFDGGHASCTQSLLQKYLREEYDIHIGVIFFWNGELKIHESTVIVPSGGDYKMWSYKGQPKYEDVLELSLFAALEWLEQQSQK